MVLSAVDAVDVHSVESRQVRRLSCDRHVESQTQLSVRAISPHVNAPVVADAGAVEAAACDRHHRKALEQGQSLWLTHISDGAQSELSVISSAPCDDLSVVGQTESVSRSCCQLNRETERNGEQMQLCRNREKWLRKRLSELRSDIVAPRIHRELVRRQSQILPERVLLETVSDKLVRAKTGGDLGASCTCCYSWWS